MSTAEMPREYTPEEVRDQFLEHAAAIVREWHKGNPAPGVIDQLTGVVLSILVLIDGESCGMPGFVLAPAPHADDKADRQACGENWHPEAPEVACDISGGLHDAWVNGHDKRLRAATTE